MTVNRVKKTIKEIIAKYPSYSEDSLIQRVQSFEYVSFDIFDTLVKRTAASANNVFSMVAAKYYRNNGKEECVRAFHDVRIAAEETARKNAKAHGREEVTLEEVYTIFPNEYDKSLREQLMEMEVLQEKAVCHANPVMKRVYQWCINHKKCIIVTSDMYLPLKTVSEILQQCGYIKYDRLFLSSAIGTTKHTGNLYKHILGELGVASKDIIHIGDSIRGDYLNARKNHIKAVWIARNPRRTKFTRIHVMRKKEKQIMVPLQKVMNSWIDPQWDSYYQFGFEVIGPLLYGFCTWLQANALKQGVHTLYFLARDGYLLQKGYQMLFPSSEIKDVYLYASRKAFHSPQFWMNPSLDDVLALHSPFSQWDCRLLCDELGVDYQTGIQFWEKNGLYRTCRFAARELLKSPQVAAFYKSVQEQVIENSKRDFKLLEDYLLQNGFQGNVGIVDLGWNGSMQKCLNRILEQSQIRADVVGYYLGLNSGAGDTLSAKVFIIDEYPHSASGSLIEFPFCKTEGSAKGYQRKPDNGIRPILCQYEYESKDEDTYAKSIQSGALAFIEACREYLDASIVDGNELWSNLRLLVRQPRKRELDLFGDIQVYEREVCTLAAPQKLRHYVFHPKQLKRDMLNSKWKIGFLKRLLRIPLPYYDIAKMVRKQQYATEYVLKGVIK